MSASQPLNSGVADHPVDSQPFYFDAGGAAAVLCVHGFTGTPYEMRGVGAALAEAGITARGIRLPGHENCEAMTHITRHAWRAAVRDAFFELRERHATVGLAGLSMGGVLSLDLAATPGLRVDALASLAAPMFLYGWQARLLLPYVTQTPLGTRMRWVKTSPGNIRDPEAQARHPSLRWCTVDAVNELRLLIGETRRKLPAIHAPLHIQHATRDTTALVASADIVYNRAGSRHKEKIILPESHHIITVDVEHRQVLKDVVRFMTYWLRPEVAAKAAAKRPRKNAAKLPAKGPVKAGAKAAAKAPRKEAGNEAAKPTGVKAKGKAAPAAGAPRKPGRKRLTR
jgi:carboxylesterase